MHKSEMGNFDYLTSNDQNLLEYLTTQNRNLYSQLNLDSKIFLSLLNEKPTIIDNTYIISSIDIFLKNNANTQFLCEKLVKNYIKSFTTRAQKDFPNEILKEEVINHIIRLNLYDKNFYNYTMFNIMFLSDDIENHDKFRVKLSKKNIDFFLEKSDKLYTSLNTYIQTSNYLIRPSLLDLRIYSNFIRFISNQIEELEQEDKNKLLERTEKLYMLILETINTIRQSARSSKELFENINVDLITNFKELNRSNKKEIKSCDLLIDKFTMDCEYNNYMTNKICIFDFSTLIDDKNYSTITNIIPIFTSYMINKDYYTVIERIKNSICNTKVNIYTKVNYILNSEEEIFMDDEIHKKLIDIFCDLEKYDESTGFYERNKTRTKIVFILDKYMNKKTYSELENKNSENFYRFYTLLLSELSDIFTLLQRCISNIDTKIIGKGVMTNPNLITDICSSCKYIYKITLYYRLISKIINSINITPDIMIKTCELYYNILNNSFYSRIYRETSEFKNMKSRNNYNLSYNLTSKICSQNTDKFYKRLFKDIYKLSNNIEYINTLADNKTYYDRDVLLNTIQLFGWFNVRNNNESDNIRNVGHILNKYIELIDIKISENQESELYSEDLPSEFLDPIMNTPIKTPIMLPSSKVIMDRTVIKNYLVFNEQDPFNRDLLNIEKLDKYNNTENVINQINDFNIKLAEWKKKFKI